MWHVALTHRVGVNGPDKLVQKLDDILPMYLKVVYKMLLCELRFIYPFSGKYVCFNDVS